MAPSQPSPARLDELCSFPALTCSGGNCPLPKNGRPEVDWGRSAYTTAENSAARTETWCPGAAFEGLAVKKPL